MFALFPVSFIVIVAPLVGLCFALKWTSFEDKEYTVVYESMTCRLAQKHCEELGGTLAHADTEERNKFLISLTDKTSGLWIGGSNAYDRKTWEWHNPITPMTFTYWGPGEPNRFDNENNLIYSKFSDGYKWADLSCVNISYVGGYICQRKQSSSGQNDDRTLSVTNRILSDGSGQKCMKLCL